VSDPRLSLDFASSSMSSHISNRPPKRDNGFGGKKPVVVSMSYSSSERRPLGILLLPRVVPTAEVMSRKNDVGEGRVFMRSFMI